MKKFLIYALSTLIITSLLVLPQYEYYMLSMLSMKQNIPSTTDTETDLQESVAPTLPSFLENSVGVHAGQDIGLIGKLDPTLPTSQIREYVEHSIDNDSEIYGIELSEEVKNQLIGRVDDNSTLEDNIINNNMGSSSGDINENIDIEVLETLEQFANR